MTMIKKSREQYKPEDDLKQSGQFMAKCTRVEQGIPNKQYEGKTMVAIEFTINDTRFPNLKGKHAAIVCGESVYVNPKTKVASHLVQHARQMGVVNPEQGFDPEQFLGKVYLITCEMTDDRAYVRYAVPVVMNATTGGPQLEDRPATPVEGDDPGESEVPF